MKTKTILITGAKGQLGSELMQLSAQYFKFKFIPTDTETLDLTKKTKIIQFLKKNKVDYIINCAAYTEVDKAEKEISLCYSINRDTVKNLLESTDKKTKIIHISTDYVFDGLKNTPYTETDTANPQSIYGKSKHEGEIILMTNRPESIIIRTSWLYSVYGCNFVKKILNLIKEKSHLKVVCDQLGTPTYAADLANAILIIISYLENKNSFYFGIFHYSNEGIASKFDFAKKILKFSKEKNCNIYPNKTELYVIQTKRPMYSVLNKQKIKKIFSIAIPEWETSLKKCINLLVK
ncbi:MAG: dTDP-4-dehydrorhamnose reductase [Bacteroidales bacterium OttesenSCG-928-I14]|jgi:dTDP-4-dehydrorhamnose reductase|nr:dTDP-4-dehydrorhamnose reductase [Bacteroidales bacterium OttesenSCG-928-I14]